MSENGERRGPRSGISRRVKSYAAVVTTGIYCQGCSARPNEANVVRFDLAAAAEAAGFRACHRCRPYRAGGLVFWNGPELVCRALQMILHGALNTGTERTLAARLGVSPRHLRRLFVRHVGGTPDRGARSPRAQLAPRHHDATQSTGSRITQTSS